MLIRHWTRAYRIVRGEFSSPVGLQTQPAAVGQAKDSTSLPGLIFIAMQACSIYPLGIC